MKIIKASTEIISHTPDLEQVIELGGRTCYKSEDKITPESANGFIERIKNFKHAMKEQEETPAAEPKKDVKSDKAAEKK